jgi:hypothetical protein
MLMPGACIAFFMIDAAINNKSAPLVRTQAYRREEELMEKMITTEAIITCPNCGFQKQETMPMDACRYFYT